MMSASRVWPIAVNTVREAIRHKLLYALLFFAILLIGTGVLVSALSYVEGSRIIQDVGLASIRIFSVGIAIFVGVGLINGEVDRRTIYTILSKPVSRMEFLVGKYVGLVLMVWLQLVTMSASFVVVSLATGAPVDAGHAAAVGLIAVELMIMIAVATLFSTFTTTMLASLYSLGIYVVGHLTRDLRALGQQADLESIRLVTQWIYKLLPDLESFNLTIKAVHGLSISTAEIWWPVLYGICYSLILLVCAVFIFQRRDLR
jgi:ABC-type transport system involved in multi-copper enzyme maturation permease subunit